MNGKTFRRTGVLTTLLFAACGVDAAGFTETESAPLEDMESAWGRPDVGTSDSSGRIASLELVDGQLVVEGWVDADLQDLWPDASRFRMVVDGDGAGFVHEVFAVDGSALAHIDVASSGEVDLEHELAFRYASTGPDEHDWLDLRARPRSVSASGRVDGGTHSLSLAIDAEGEVVESANEGPFGETSIARIHALGATMNDAGPIFATLDELELPLALGSDWACESLTLARAASWIGASAACCGPSSSPACLGCVQDEVDQAPDAC